MAIIDHTQPKTSASNLIGRRFNRLVVMERCGSDKNRKAMWRCRCDCGRESMVNTSSLRSKNTQSCGCLGREHVHKTHGYAGDSVGPIKHRTYEAWQHMKKRCDHPRGKDIKHYQGISYDPRWKAFEAFLEDMGDCPFKHELDRLDNSLGYCKENCRWATELQQSRNRDFLVPITHNGKSMLMVDWAREVGISASALCNRLARGWTLGEALTPYRGRITISCSVCHRSVAIMAFGYQLEIKSAICHKCFKP